MNLPILQSEVKTMSSREIATLCEKEHKNVIRDIRNMLDSLDGSLLNHEYYQILTDEMGLLKIKDTLYTNEQNGQHYEIFVVQNLNNTKSTYFNLTIEQLTNEGII